MSSNEWCNFINGRKEQRHLKNIPSDSDSWGEALSEEFDKDYFKSLIKRLAGDEQLTPIYPPAKELFTAFHLTTPKNLKVVIIGQDPYHGAGEAHGLAFSVKNGTKIPPSLKNILKEVQAEYPITSTDTARTGDLSDWARQGVLLINSVLTVQKDHANSHKNIGWEQFTDAVLNYIDTLDQPIVFILWGKQAEAKKKLIHNKKRLVVTSAHPSPLSAFRGFFGSKPFSRTNHYLEEHEVNPIEWL